MVRLRKNTKKDYRQFEHPSDESIRMECRECKRQLKLNQFYFAHKSGYFAKYGRLRVCVSCMAIQDSDSYFSKRNKELFQNACWQKKNKKRKNKNNREYYERNKDKVKAAVRKRYHEAKALAQQTQNTHHLGPHTNFPPPQAQNQEVRVGVQPAQNEEFAAHQDYNLLCSFTPILNNLAVLSIF